MHELDFLLNQMILGHILFSMMNKYFFNILMSIKPLHIVIIAFHLRNSFKLLIALYIE